jgi:peptidylprolyl isomerase
MSIKSPGNAINCGIKFMKKILLILTCATLLFSCNPKPKEDVIAIHTPYGVIEVELYDKTPLHHKNFLKLAESGYYDSSLFHRVIEGFMIQGGDPDSKHAKEGQLLGDGDTNYRIPFEYVSEYMHKRGVLAAARESDDVNPAKESSGCQFYIVQGRKFTDAGLDSAEAKRERSTKSFILLRIIKQEKDSSELKQFQQFIRKRDVTGINRVIQKYRDQVDAQYMKTAPWKLSPEQRRVYKTIGGAPHLDGAYTVFGEVVSGMEVVDRIAAVPRDSNDRPLRDVRIWMEVITRRK